MKPYCAVQPLLRLDKDEKKLKLEGSCFQLWAPNHFITANHCVKDAEPSELKILNAFEDANDLKCNAIYRHPKADIAVLKTEGEVPKRFEKFKLFDKEISLGL